MDEQGFTEWAVGRQRLLLRSAYLLTGDAHRAEDLVQESLTKVALRWARLADGNPTAYALTIITRDNISWWRRRREVPGETTDGAARREEPEIALVVQRALQ
ncbi:MAG: sigma factor, partial [Nocardioides sp.]|uniref:sigma factor n=1 Tax=Nocardioides sp. TaxID=35761 RepID=UPI00326758F2